MTKHFAFVFPGQGSQSVGMLDSWSAHAEVKRSLEEAQSALSEDLGALMRDGPKEALALTTNTQPLMLLADVAIYRVWIKETGATPQLMAGHSLGEYAALVASGVLSLTQALPLVRFRAQAMQDAVAVGVGAMAAILGLPSEQVKTTCDAVSAEFRAAHSSELVQAVNFNEPGQTVIAGTVAGVDQACEALKALGAKRALKLPVSAPFHCTLMQPAAERLREMLADTDFHAPQVPVLNNVDVLTPSAAQDIKDALFRQAYHPVLWVQTVQAMQSRGIDTIVECGPGLVLSGFTKRIAPDLESCSLKDWDNVQSVWLALQGNPDTHTHTSLTPSAPSANSA